LGRIRIDLGGEIAYHHKMRKDVYGQFIYDENDICDLYLKDPEKKLYKILSETEVPFPQLLDLSYTPQVIHYTDPKISVAEFDTLNQNKWHMPQQYRDMDIAQFVLEQCQDDSELQRAGMELLLFQERDMFDLLKYLKYLVDTMREHNIVWGVGRGSSVSSFVLYLIGIHKINSLYYDLSIDEFLK
jgi:DNA polymerase III alpha subunit